MKLTLILAVLLSSKQTFAQTGDNSYKCLNVVGPTPPSWVVSSKNPNYKYKTLTYITHADGQAESLDIYLPPGVVNPPLLAVVHGGGFTGGTRHQFANYVPPFVAQGFAVANISYRLAGTFDTTNAGLNTTGVVTLDPAANTFPAALQDVRCAIRYLRANASSLGFSSTSIGGYGVSAGGNLIAMLGTTLDHEQKIYGHFDGASQTLDSRDCTIGSPIDPSPMQATLAPASLQLVIAESGNDTVSQANNTIDNSAWGNVQYLRTADEIARLFNTHFEVPKDQVLRCTAPGFHVKPEDQCVTLAGLSGNPNFKKNYYPLAYPDTQFARNAYKSLYAAPVFFLLNGALDPVVGPQNSADLFDALTGADAAGTPVLVESYMKSGPNPNGVSWSATALSPNATPVTYFLMTNQGHIPALLEPGRPQHDADNNGAGPDLQAASCAVLNALHQTLR